MIVLTLHALEGWFYTASVDGGPRFQLGYYDLDDWCEENKIEDVVDESDQVGDIQGEVASMIYEENIDFNDDVELPPRKVQGVKDQFLASPKVRTIIHELIVQAREED